ncbi:MAG: TonB-dependent receptor, partial [Bacteroidia bacterium]|nr:TonB-dependent receptor [Bacteroidia bacterium]
MEREILTTKRKALRINLRDDIYGSFAEIGAGQEVARFFFTAGGASGTIAKTISAYDKSFSDHLYDRTPSRRYVSEERLTDMLDKEYEELSHLLSEKRGENTLFFTFADTLSTINFTKTNEGNGWLGMKFQLEKGQKPNVVVMHVELLENDTFLQQSTIGIMGVNLIYACYMHYKTPNIFIQSLLDNLSTDRIRVTMLRMSG